MQYLKKQYSEIFYKYLDSIIDFSKYDEKINASGLYFGKSNDIKHNISSDYFSVLNNFYVEKLSLEEQELFKTNALDVVKKTYINILKKDNQTMIMYNPPMPEHNVKNGNLVLEFVYGKNIVIIPDDQYLKFIKRQREFIECKYKEYNPTTPALGTIRWLTHS